jgi:hypothetical protein
MSSMQSPFPLPLPQISVDDLLSVQGAVPGLVRPHHASVINMAERAIRAGKKLVRPVVWVNTLRVQGIQHDALLLEGGYRLRGEFISGKLAGADKVSMVIGTLGSLLDDEINAAMDKNPAWGYMLDSYGSICAKALGEHIMAQIQTSAEAENMSTSMPLLPGHICWPVDEGLPQIFSIVQPDPAVVRLTESAQIIPRKSFAFLIGLGALQNDSYPCEFCNLRATCPMRH